MTECASQHFGLWTVQARWINAAASAYAAGDLRPSERGERVPGNVQAGKLPKEVYAAGDNPSRDEPLYRVDESGIAFVEINGQLTKGRSSFGGTSNVRVRQALRAAERDRDVRGIMSLVDSPGGTVSGQQPMADELARITRSGGKPTAVHAEDGMHSAALWYGVQAGRVTASPMTEIGSIGTVATVYDSSGRMERDGIKVHVVSTGPHKGAFTPGSEVTDEQIEALQQRLDDLNGFFLNAVAKGRDMPIAKVRELATGEDWLAKDAADRGLIDAVMSQDDAIRSFRRMLDGRDSERGNAMSVRRQALKIIEAKSP